MGNFLVVVNSDGARQEAERLFQSGLYFAQELKSQVPSRIVRCDRAIAATFPRENGSGTPIMSDSTTGNWLLASGTWFGSEGLASGQESLLLERYAKIGAVRLARELEGFFVIVIGDARTREILVLTDVIGSCHCFRRSWKHGEILSSSSMLLATLASCRLDPDACQEFLNTGVIYEDRTLHQEVRKLEPASVFRFTEGGRQSQEHYWSIAELAPESIAGQDAVEALW